MIKNRRQFGIAEKKLRELSNARDGIDLHDGQAKIHWDAHTRLIDEITAEVEEFRDLERGKVDSFDLNSLDHLGEVLIKARIAKGWTQQDLAEKIGVSAQAVQKDESKEYAGSALDRMADVLDVLECSFTARVGFRELGNVDDRLSSKFNSLENRPSVTFKVNSSSTLDMSWLKSIDFADKSMERAISILRLSSRERHED